MRPWLGDGDRSTRRRRRSPARRRAGLVLLVMAAAGAGLAARAAPASAGHCGTADMEEILLGDADLPTGLAPVPASTGEVEVQTIRDLSPSTPMALLQRICAYRRLWVDETGATVAVSVWDLRSATHAEVWRARMREALEGGGGQAFPVAIADASARVIAAENPVTGEPGFTSLVLLGEGRYVFMIGVNTPTPALEAARDMAMAQAARAAAGDTDPVEAASRAELAGEITGGFIGTLLLYQLGVTGLARLRDPLAVRQRSRVLGRGYGPGHVVDVSRRAADRQAPGVVLVGVQAFGVAILAVGLLPAVWPEGLLASFAGLAMVAVTWVLRRSGRAPTSDGGRGHGRRLFTGRRPLRVTALFALATALFLGALLLGVAGALQSTDQHPVVTSYSPDGHEVVDSSVVWLTPLVIALVLVGGGVLAYRWARRLAALDARVLIERDPRPFVLYLRSFEDDGLKVRAAVGGRRPLIEELSPRRFDRFEEVVVRELNQLGPVIALNPPGTKLSPLGAARTTLGNEAWQDTISGWMAGAAAIVVAAPPHTTTPGLEWELQQIHAGGLWPKTFFVCPAVADDPSRNRWASFHPVLSSLVPDAGWLPADPALVLAAMLRPGQGWSVVTATRRTEWTYSEALREMTRRIQPAAGVHPPLAASVP